MKLQTKVAAAAKALSREPIMSALAHAMRKVVPRPRMDSPAEIERKLAEAGHDMSPKTKTKRARASRVGFRRYEVLQPEAWRRHSARTWTRFMLETALAHEDTRTATQAHKVSERYPEKTLDFNWMVKQGYIAYK